MCSQITENNQSPNLLSNHSKLYTCQMCNKCYKSRGGLYTHHKQVHTTNQDYVCSICSKSFIYPSMLLEHIRIHKGDRPYCCNHCGRKFYRKNDLQRHIRTHTGEKPYSCIVCQKSFNRKAQLRIHQRSHSGDKPFQCTRCQKHFNTRSNLNRHCKTHCVIELDSNISVNNLDTSINKATTGLNLSQVMNLEKIPSKSNNAVQLVSSLSINDFSNITRQMYEIDNNAQYILAITNNGIDKKDNNVINHNVTSRNSNNTCTTLSNSNMVSKILNSSHGFKEPNNHISNTNSTNIKNMNWIFQDNSNVKLNVLNKIDNKTIGNIFSPTFFSNGHVQDQNSSIISNDVKHILVIDRNSSKNNFTNYPNSNNENNNISHLQPILLVGDVSQNNAYALNNLNFNNYNNENAHNNVINENNSRLEAYLTYISQFASNLFPISMDSTISKSQTKMPMFSKE